MILWFSNTNPDIFLSRLCWVSSTRLNILFLSNRRRTGGIKTNEKKNSKIIPQDATTAKSFMGGISLKYRDINPTAVVSVVRKQGRKTFFKVLAIAFSMVPDSARTCLSRCENICTMSQRARAMTRGGTIVVTLFRVMPNMGNSPMVDPMQMEIFKTATPVR
jgi:hypothetical protein